ncbi:M060R [Myxoma virus]|nr:m60R [Myxoma virus]WLM68514.1 M060R [Myxoma virus]WNN26941.1 M060R [Myxoma virus]
MDHGKYLLTIFLNDDDSFFKYLAAQEDDVAMSDVHTIVDYLNFLLALLIKSKDKLEAVGYYYAPLSEEYKAVFDFTDTKSLKQLFNKQPVYVESDSPICVDKGYLADFVLATTRLKKQLNLTLDKDVTYVDPYKDKRFANILSILHKN